MANITATKIESMSELAAYLGALRVSSGSTTALMFTSAVYNSTAGTITLKTAESEAGAGGTANDAFCVIKDIDGTTPATASIYVDNSGTALKFGGSSRLFNLSGQGTGAITMFPLYAYKNANGVIIGTALDSTNNNHWSYFGFCKSQKNKVAIFGYNTASTSNNGYAASAANSKNSFFSTVYGASITAGTNSGLTAVMLIERASSNLFGSDVNFSAFFEPPIFGTDGDRLKNVFVHITAQQQNNAKVYGIINHAGHTYLSNGIAAMLDT